jgi:hypothetical protein
MILMGALKKSCRELVKSPHLGLSGCCFQSYLVAIAASLLDLMRRILQELLQQIFVSVNDLQSNFLRILSECFQPPLILLVGVDIGIEKISDDLVSFFLEVLERVDSTVGATNMK